MFGILVKQTHKRTKLLLYIESYWKKLRNTEKYLRIWGQDFVREVAFYYDFFIFTFYSVNYILNRINANTVQCRHNVDNFLQNTQERHSIDRPSKELWVAFVASKFYLCSAVVITMLYVISCYIRHDQTFIMLIFISFGSILWLPCTHNLRACYSTFWLLSTQNGYYTTPDHRILNYYCVASCGHVTEIQLILHGGLPSRL